jgi:hypothetical protein
MDITMIYTQYFNVMVAMLAAFMLMCMMDPVTRLGAVIGTEDKS